MVKWNGADDRAVAPNVSLWRGTEVVAGSPYLVLASAAPLCLGVYSGGRALPLRYVSPMLANSAKRAGWYAPARAGASFRLAVTPTQQCRASVARFGGDALVADVVVRGERANPRGREFDIDSTADYVVDGAVLERQVSAAGVVKKTVQEFVFDGAPTDVVLDVRAATRGPRVPVPTGVQRYKSRAAGRHIATRRRCRTAVHRLRGLRKMVEQSVTLRVCTVDWMKQHGILPRDF